MDTTTWSTSGTVARTTAQFYFGVASASLTYAGSGTVLIQQSTRSTVTAGLTYTASFYLKQSVDAGGVVCNFMWYNAGGSIILDDSHQTNDPNTAWQRFSQTRTAPANATSCSFRIYQTSGEGGGAVATIDYVDAVLIEQASSALPYFDGTYVDDYAGYGLENKSWTGTANASTSTASWYLGNTRTNRITNPSFETNLSNWASGQTGSVRSTDFAYSGTNSLKVTVNTADSNVAYHSSSSYGVGSVTLSLYVYTPIGSTLAGRTISTSVEGGTATSTTTTNNAGTLVAGQWVRVSHIRNVTVAGTMTVVYRLSGTMATAAGQLLYFDAALGEQTSSALPYFDGTYQDAYTGYTLTDDRWNGTADASTSTATWGLTSSFVGSELNDDTKGLA